MLELVLLMIFIIWVFSFFSLAPWVPTKNTDLERINKIIDLKENENFLEIWCWTARVSIFLAKQNKNSKIIWIELSPYLYFISKIKAYFLGQKNLKIIYWNALNLKIEKYDAIYFFWMPETVIKKILPKISKIQNPKFRFISYCFQMKNDYFLEEKYKPEGKLTIYKYKIKQKND